MPFTTVGLKVLIASPSDLCEERDAAERAVHAWNALHAIHEGVTLLPVRWETHAVPTAGVRPQAAINRQLVESADMLIGLFWTKLGTDTGVAESGTVEEINQIVAAGKPAMLYFSKRPVDPSKIDTTQLDRLKSFQQQTYQTALTGTFGSVGDLEQRLKDDLTRRVRDMKPSIVVVAADGSATKTTDPHAELEAEAAEEIEAFFNRVRSTDYARGPKPPNVAMALFPVHPLGEPLDLDEIDRRSDTQGRIDFRPIGAAGWNTNLTGRSIIVDDSRGRMHEAKEPATTVSELRDDATIWAVRDIYVYQTGDTTKAFGFQTCEREMFSFMSRYLNTLRKLGIQGPVLAALQFSGLRGVQLRPDAANRYDQRDFRPLEEDTITLGPIRLDSSDNVPKAFFKLTTRIWRDAGIRYDPCFDREGKYTGDDR